MGSHLPGRPPIRPGELSGGPPIRPGDVYAVGRAASPQFAAGQDILFRVVAVPGWPTYQGWIWLAGYVLDARGEAVVRREIFVRVDGLRMLRPGPAVVRRPPRDPHDVGVRPAFRDPRAALLGDRTPGASRAATAANQPPGWTRTPGSGNQRTRVGHD